MFTVVTYLCHIIHSVRYILDFRYSGLGRLLHSTLGHCVIAMQNCKCICANRFVSCP